MEIQVGSKVKIIDTGKIFSTYTEGFEACKFKNLTANWPLDDYEDFDWFVFKTHKHYHKTYGLLYAIRTSCGKHELLLEDLGISLIKEKFSVWY